MNTRQAFSANSIQRKLKLFQWLALAVFGLATIAPTDVLAQVCNSMAFTEVTLASGINHKYVHPATAGNPMTGGAVAEDFDNDGWLDLYVVQGAGGPNLLYMNNGIGGFVDEAAARNADVQAASVAASAADYDNDGDMDIVVSIAESQSRVLINNGSGNFTSQILLPDPSLVSTSSSWGDVDNDGFLELAIGQWNDTQQSFFLYKNDGAGGLSQYQFRTAPHDDIFVFSPRFADLNGDGLQDLHVVSDFLNSQLYMNIGGGMFDNVTATNGTGGATGGENEMGHSTGDYDNDGDLDIFTSNISGDGGGNRLYNNNGSGVFSVVANAAGMLDGHWGWAASFGDLDNDGDLDLYHVNGWHAQQAFVNTPSRLFMNNNDSTFSEVAACAGADDMRVAKGMLQFDYDNDGDLDIFIINSQDMNVVGEDFPGTPVLLRNDTNNGNHWLQVTLNGAPPMHRNGIGSRVYVQNGGTTMMHEMNASTNFLAQNPSHIAHFGTGSATTVNEVSAEWVTGDATVIPDVATDQRISVPSPVATVSSRQLRINEQVTADASAESSPVEWEVEGVTYADPANVSFSSVGTKDLTLLVYDAGQNIVVRKEILRVEVSSAEITSPVGGTVLSGATETFNWTANGEVVTDWQLLIGTFAGDSSIYDSGVLPAGTLSTSATGLPVDGSTIHARLLYTVGGTQNSVDYTYIALGGSTTPEITSPAPGGTLAGSDVTFNWTDNGAGVTFWGIRVGTTAGGKEIYQSAILSGGVTTDTVAGIPTDGSTVHVELSWVIGVVGVDPVQTTQYTYTASSAAGTPAITTPAPGSTLTGASATFNWVDNGETVTDWQLQIGTSAGDNSLYDSGLLGAGVLSATAGGLPTDGSTVHVRLSYTAASVTNVLDYTYTAFTAGGGGTPAITTPAPGSTLTSDTVTFNWADNGAGVTNWGIRVGTSAGGSQIYQSPIHAGSVLSDTVSGIPTDGSTVHVELSWVVGVVGVDPVQKATYTYTASTAAGTPAISSPAPGSTLGGASQAFSWVDNGAVVTDWQLTAGSFAGDASYYDSGPMAAGLFSTTASGLPTDGSTVHVRLSYTIASVTSVVDYTYTAFNAGGGGSPEITSPVPGSTLSGSSITLNWTDNGAGVTFWGVRIGTSPGARDIHQSAIFGGGTTSTTVGGIPTDGSTIYVELSWVVGVVGVDSGAKSQLQLRDRTLTAQPAPAR